MGTKRHRVPWTWKSYVQRQSWRQCFWVNKHATHPTACEDKLDHIYICTPKTKVPSLFLVIASNFSVFQKSLWWRFLIIPGRGLSVHKFDGSLRAPFPQEVDSQAPGSELGTQAPWRPCKSAIRPWGCPEQWHYEGWDGEPSTWVLLTASL